MGPPEFRRDHERIRQRHKDTRPLERILAHYQLERRLADRLRTAPPERRARAYSEVYQELFDTLFDHPQRENVVQLNRADAELKTIVPFLRPETRFLELGCGDASVAFKVAEHCAEAFGLDVTDQLLRGARPDNFHFLKTSGSDIPLDAKAIDLAYSNQLIEHLHPDDANGQLREVWRVLRPGGRYLCATPNPLNGPHDISEYFDKKATGLHIHEYQRRELARLFRSVGFREIRFLWTPKGKNISIPKAFLAGVEAALSGLPFGMSSRMARGRFLYGPLNAKIVAVK